jgi:hypothetical protein
MALNAEVLMPRHRNPPDGNGGPNHWERRLRANGSDGGVNPPPLTNTKELRRFINGSSHD